MALEHDTPRLIGRDVRRRFDRAAQTFDDADFVHSVTRDSLFDRLQPIVIEAKTIVDLGSATGSATRPLARRFRGAHIVSVDVSRRMLEASITKRGWRTKHSAVQGSACSLPLADHSADVVFSNLLLPWIDDLDTAFAEVARVLRQGGLFLFATLGPDSLMSLRHAWQQVDNYRHINEFPDMHDVGDGLVRAGLVDPVLDVDRLTITYEDTKSLFRDLTSVGGRNSLGGRSPSLTGKHGFGRMLDALHPPGRNDRIEIDLELVYGHCWGSGIVRRDGEIRIGVDGIPTRRRDLI